MIIRKFGGTSVSTPARIRQIADILQARREEEAQMIVVCSAFGGVTDQLLRMADMARRGDTGYQQEWQSFRARHQEAARALVSEDQRVQVIQDLEANHQDLHQLLYGIHLLRDMSPRTRDHILSFGERNSNYLIAQALQHRGLASTYVDARHLIRTDNQHGKAVVAWSETAPLLREKLTLTTDIQFITGFIGRSKDGSTTTLGRGGSDYTAALIARAVGADMLEIWTDVSGVYTADPRKVHRAHPIAELSYAEALEMSHFGAKVIYPLTLQPVLDAGIPIRIKNTLQPAEPGTVIHTKSSPHPGLIRGISSIPEVSMLTLQGPGLAGIPGTAARMFRAIADAGINVILITQASSEAAITVAIEPVDKEKARMMVEKAFAEEIAGGRVEPVLVEDHLSTIAIVGENMRFQPGIAARLFTHLGRDGINVRAIAQGSSERNTSVLVHQEDEVKALNAIHAAFFPEEIAAIHLYLIGVGLIGRTLLQQIAEQQEALRQDRQLEIRMVGLANSRHMIFRHDGLELDRAEAELEQGQPMDLEQFLQRMEADNLTNAVFVDATASGEVAACYARVLDRSQTVITANKIATTGPHANYRNLHQLARKRSVHWGYETNVGAGLPVISTIRTLQASGDVIHRIEGVLSGSLSFLFNQYDGTVPFSELVRKAREQGLTEPDPREDLSGQDVMRKLLILARELGAALEMTDISCQGFLPDVVFRAGSVESFLELLSDCDDAINVRFEQAREQGQVLRFVACYDGGAATVGLQGVPMDHPFAGLRSSDNMIVLTSERYQLRPLVIAGPGAGPAVTAGGVLAEIITLAGSIHS